MFYARIVNRENSFCIKEKTENRFTAVLIFRIVDIQ